jgi:membrane-associated phospholipid phosphatase
LTRPREIHMARILIIFIPILFSYTLIGQDIRKDTILQKQDYKVAESFIIPGVLLTTGIFLNHEDRKRDVNTFIRGNLGETSTSLDDYLLHIPLATIILADLINHEDRTLLKTHLSQFLLTELVTLSGTYILKWTVNARRPLGGPRSFPSAHTAYAFAGSTYVFHILKDDHPFWAHMSFIPAIATGMLRISNNRHWSSDVLFGAGLGMLVPTLFFQFKWRHRLNSTESAYQFDIYPGGLSMKYRF